MYIVTAPKYQSENLNMFLVTQIIQWISLNSCSSIHMTMLFLNIYGCSEVLVNLKQYSKICVKWPLKNGKKVFMTNGSLMKVKSIAECPMELSALLLTCIKQ